MVLCLLDALAVPLQATCATHTRTVSIRIKVSPSYEYSVGELLSTTVGMIHAVVYAVVISLAGGGTNTSASNGTGRALGRQGR